MTAAIILAGSHVWKEDSLESLCPRPLLPVANSPLIAYALASLRAAGVPSGVICANESSFLLQEQLGDGSEYGIDLYYYEDRMPRGPAGCARDSSAIVPADQYIVLDGTIIPSIDLGALLETHGQAGAAATIVYNNDEAVQQIDYGGHLSPAGIYVFSRRAIEQVGETGYQDIKEVLIPRLRNEQAAVTAYPAERVVPRISGLDAYLSVQGWMLERISEGQPPAGYHPRGAAWCHETARIAESARLVGPLLIGPEAVIEDDAVIIGPSVIGAECVVERGALVGRSVLWSYSAVGAEARVEHCLLATAVSAEPGVVRHGEICRPTGLAAASDQD